MPTATRPEKSTRQHWAVRMNHRNRTGSFAVALVLFGLALQPLSPPTWAWGLLALQFLLYPQLVYRIAMAAPRPLDVEMRVMQIDALCFGAWSAALGFPLWISFAFGMAACMNLGAFQGPLGILKALAGLTLGASGVLAVLGWRFQPDLSLPLSLLAMALLSVYFLLFAHGAHTRTLKLHKVREQLQDNERALASQLAEVQRLQAQLKADAEHDHLTGLYNRRYLDATIQRELSRCQREQTPLTVMMLDIDHFKRINDAHGHPVGDTVLTQVAQVLGTALRAGDIACRYGGEEFLLLLPNMPLAAAQQRAETLRQSVAALRPQAGTQTLSLEISIGLASYPQHAQDAANLLARADAALYRAKTLGRNRVEVSE